MTYLSHRVGNIFETFPPYTANGTPSTPAAGTVYGMRVDVPAGQSLTGAKFRAAASASGSVPTTVRAGVADAAGVMLAITGNLNAAATWAAGTPVTCPWAGGAIASGASARSLMICVFFSGAYGSASPTLYLISLANATGMVADGSDAPPSFQWAGQTDLPIVGGSLNMTTPTARSYYMGLYQ